MLNTPKTVFLVDDDKDDQEFFVDALAEVEYASLYGIANNGLEALDRLEKSDVLPDLIFLDINMPLMNGMECLTRLMENPRTNKIPVVILSTTAVPSNGVRHLGAKAFINKPCNAKMLREQLEEVIESDLIEKGNAHQTFQTLHTKQHGKLSN